MSRPTRVLKWLLALTARETNRRQVVTTRMYPEGVFWRG